MVVEYDIIIMFSASICWEMSRGWTLHTEF
jgi:hypothetical protein